MIYKIVAWIFCKLGDPLYSTSLSVLAGKLVCVCCGRQEAEDGTICSI